MSYKAQMNGGGESYSGVVLRKQPNKGRGGPQEAVEGRPLTKENMEEPHSYRTQSRESESNGLDRVRQAAKKDKGLRFTALLHWVLDLDVKSFFDRVGHDWMIQLVEHRVADQRIVRLIQKWWKAGVMENGQWFETEEGTRQGSVISPILANL